ncbi:MAG: magnesium transporter CorA family protein [Propionibacteriaceae bacterium]|nr:magnesium transporter CorA family protein [Propionibacteriaceae bacterium]
MELRWVDSDGVQERDLTELTALRSRSDGYLWLDIPVWSDEVERLLAEEFCFHPMAITESRERNHVPRVHVYPDHLFIVIHAPEIGKAGHVHYLELDSFVGKDFLVTVHGPLNPVVPLDVALRETRQVTGRMESGRLRPNSPFGLMYAIVSTIIRGQEALVADLARQVGLLEQRVMASAAEDPQLFLAELFTARHELLTIRTMATQGGEIYQRAITLTSFAPPAGMKSMADLLDQYKRVSRISQSQLDFLMGVTEFYRAQTDTKMTIAAERLAVIAAVTLPVTAISSVVGMNVIVNDHTHWVLLSILLVVMAVMSGLLLRWAKRQGWW